MKLEVKYLRKKYRVLNIGTNEKKKYQFTVQVIL